jgi:anthranilate phosphoribosyltransferase
VGVYDPTLTETIAKVLGSLGGKAAFVVHGHGGLDELTTSGRNLMSHLHNGQVNTFEFDARKLGLRPAKAEQLTGGDPPQNATILRNLLNCQDDSPRRDVVLLNSAAALAAEDGDLAAGLVEAEASLRSGAALEKLDALISFSQKVSA